MLCLFKILVLYLLGHDFFLFLNSSHGYTFLGVFSGERFHESPLLEEKSPLFSCHCQEAARDSWIEGSPVHISPWKCTEAKSDCKLSK